MTKKVANDRYISPRMWQSKESNIDFQTWHSAYIINATGNGYITTATLREILHELDDKLTPDDLDGIITEIDEDGSGTIDFDGIHFY